MTDMIRILLIVLIFILGGLIFLILAHQEQSKKAKRLQKKLKFGPIQIKCKRHGIVTLGMEYYEKQKEIGILRCPHCDLIPLKIWKFHE